LYLNLNYSTANKIKAFKFQIIEARAKKLKVSLRVANKKKTLFAPIFRGKAKLMFEQNISKKVNIQIFVH